MVKWKLVVLQNRYFSLL